MTIGFAIGIGALAGFCILATALYVYERWLWEGAKSAVAWARS